MKNETTSFPSEILEHLPPVATATFKHGTTFYTYAPKMDSMQFMEAFPDHKRVTAMLSSSGSSWEEKVCLFYVEDCFDPPVYVQFGSSFEDCYESFCDNEPSLKIETSDLGDYGISPDGNGNGWDNATCSFDSNGNAIDTESVKGFELEISSVTFAA